MSRFITKAIFSGTTLTFSITGASVNSVYTKACRIREIKRHPCVLLFLNRKTGKLVDTRSL